eukprot:Platyproteum_vivax@DN2889_c0_g1_i1.p1
MIGGGSTIPERNCAKKVCYFYHDSIGHFHYGPHHPMRPHRVRMTHELIKAYDMLDKLAIYKPKLLDPEEFTKFHANDYIDFLQLCHPCNVPDLTDEISRFNLDSDCPVFEGLFEYCQMYSSGSVGGAAELNQKDFEIAVNWAGGMHHGKSHEASGFCYVNDCVLAILELLKHHQRVMYIDIDIHHGDGVEEAFYGSNRVMCVSFHQYGDYFPGTGGPDDIGVSRGTGHSVNVPLSQGMDDDMFASLFDGVIDKCLAAFKPEAVVLQCGADSLAGDRLGCWNLSLRGHGHGVERMRKYGLPLLLLGGGGYTIRNVPVCWTNHTAVSLGLAETLPAKIPEHKFYDSYPEGMFTVYTSNMENRNTWKDCEHAIKRIDDQMRYINPGAAMPSAYNLPPADIREGERVDTKESSDDAHNDMMQTEK